MSGAIVDRLVHEPYAFGLFQAIRLIERSDASKSRIGYFGDAAREAIRLTNVDSLSFPAAQVSSAYYRATEEGGRFVIETSLLGLYGVFSPLPLNYTAELISWQEEGRDSRERLRDFLDIFNHRLLSLAYRIDEYGRLLDDCHRAGAGVPEAALSAILALDSSQDGTAPGLGDFSLARVLVSATRSASGLKAWLSSLFPDVPIKIEQFCPRWVRIPPENQAVLGITNSRLTGAESDFEGAAVLGELMYDMETRFRVHLGPMKWQPFTRFLPGRPDYLDLIAQVDEFLSDKLGYDVMLALLGAECRHLRTCLDGASSQLGFTAGLFSENAAETDLCLTLDVDMAGDPPA